MGDLGLNELFNYLGLSKIDRPQIVVDLFHLLLAQSGIIHQKAGELSVEGFFALVIDSVSLGADGHSTWLNIAHWVVMGIYRFGWIIYEEL